MVFISSVVAGAASAASIIFSSVYISSAANLPLPKHLGADEQSLVPFATAYIFSLFTLVTAIIGLVGSCGKRIKVTLAHFALMLCSSASSVMNVIVWIVFYGLVWPVVFFIFFTTYLGFWSIWSFLYNKELREKADSPDSSTPVPEEQPDS